MFEKKLFYKLFSSSKIVGDVSWRPLFAVLAISNIFLLFFAIFKWSRRFIQRQTKYQQTYET